MSKRRKRHVKQPLPVVINQGTESIVLAHQKVGNFSGLIRTDQVIEMKEPPITWTGEKVGKEEFRTWLSFLKWSYDTHKIESQIRLLFNYETGEWAALPFPQTGVNLSTVEDTLTGDEKEKIIGPLLKKGFALLGSGHHHSAASAFQSGTDHADELKNIGLHFTVGNMDKKEASFHLRVVVRGVTYSKVIKDEWFSDISLSLLPEDLTEFPEEWKERVKVKTYTTPNYGAIYGEGYNYAADFGWFTDRGYRASLPADRRVRRKAFAVAPPKEDPEVEDVTDQLLELNPIWEQAVDVADATIQFIQGFREGKPISEEDEAIVLKESVLLQGKVLQSIKSFVNSLNKVFPEGDCSNISAFGFPFALDIASLARKVETKIFKPESTPAIALLNTLGNQYFFASMSGGSPLCPEVFPDEGLQLVSKDVSLFEVDYLHILAVASESLRTPEGVRAAFASNYVNTALTEAFKGATTRYYLDAYHVRSYLQQDKLYDDIEEEEIETL